MKINFGKVFQRFSKDKNMRGAVNIPHEEFLWPENWLSTSYKTYDRFNKIKLPKPNVEVIPTDSITARSSIREWGIKPITLQQLSNILFFSCGVTKRSDNPNTWRRVQASAGGRYPVEVYIVNFIQGELENRVYHYNVKEHALDILWEFPLDDKKSIEEVLYYDWCKGAAVGIFLTGVTSRVNVKYGERGYRYMYYEAGAIAQNINMLSTTQGIGATIIGGVNDGNIEKMLDVDGEIETSLLAVALGNLK